MDRFTIENIINYCNEVCEKEERWGRENEANYGLHDTVKGYLNDLQRYKDLENQGRLTEQKLSIGQAVYLAESMEEYKVLEITIDIAGISYLARTKDRRFICFRENEIGGTVLLTKKEK